MLRFIKVFGRGEHQDDDTVTFIDCKRIIAIQANPDEYDEEHKSAIVLRGVKEAFFCKETPVEILKLIAECED